MDTFTAPRAPKRKRGLQQRLHATEESIETDSVLYGLLMTFLAKGILSAVTIHSIAKAAQKDFESAAEGKIFPKLKNLASLSHGRNALRSINGMLAKESALPMPKEISMPYTTGAAFAHICLPHEYFAAMFEDKQQWHDCILPDPEAVARFWENFQHHPCMDKHPVKQRKDWKRTVLPLSLHGDEVPVIGVGKIWCRSVLSFSWCSLVANALGATGDNIMFYIWGIFEKYAQSGTDGTMQSFWTIMAWSFQTLMEGIWPAKDWNGKLYSPSSAEGKKRGKALAGGFSAVLVQLSGDLDYNTKWLGAPNSTAANRPCSLCRATLHGPSTYLDNRNGAKWSQRLACIYFGCDLFSAINLFVWQVCENTRICCAKT